MLTRDLLQWRIREGVLRPTFVKASDPSLVALADTLVAEVDRSPGQSARDLDARLSFHAGAHTRPKVARGLCKLLRDRVELEEPALALEQQRLDVFRQARELRATLAPDASLDDYERLLRRELAGGLEPLREQLYGDLPERRRVLRWDKVTGASLLQRYNLALAQGPLLEAKRLTVVALAPELRQVRRVLRWLRFCRLVAEVERTGEGWTLTVEGPGAMLALQKKYGLQLATFLGAVPSLKAWTLSAEVKVGRRTAALELSHEDPLVSLDPRALGYVPPEVRALAQGFADSAWAVDVTPLPRQVGAKGLCVPDLQLTQGGGRTVAIELFHAWHRGPLARRLRDLQSRPDPDLLLGVDRALGELPELEGHPQVFRFRGFPTARGVRLALERPAGTD